MNYKLINYANVVLAQVETMKTVHCMLSPIMICELSLLLVIVLLTRNNHILNAHKT